MKYKFKYKYKNSFFWKTKDVIGHSLEYYDEKIFNGRNELVQVNRHPQNVMVLYYEDGSIERISEWDKCDMKLGIDWKLAIQRQMEKEVGQDVKLNL